MVLILLVFTACKKILPDNEDESAILITDVEITEYKKDSSHPGRNLK